jgi:hypothetical protein
VIPPAAAHLIGCAVAIGALAAGAQGALIALAVTCAVLLLNGVLP